MDFSVVFTPPGNFVNDSSFFEFSWPAILFLIVVVVGSGFLAILAVGLTLVFKNDLEDIANQHPTLFKWITVLVAIMISALNFWLFYHLEQSGSVDKYAMSVVSSYEEEVKKNKEGDELCLIPWGLDDEPYKRRDVWVDISEIIDDSDASSDSCVTLGEIGAQALRRAVVQNGEITDREVEAYSGSKDYLYLSRYTYLGSQDILRAKGLNEENTQVYNVKADVKNVIDGKVKVRVVADEFKL